jgi:hypothetical protein
MSEHSLPKDASCWPENPFELFGIPESADRRELRRAYTKLIRVYKPEHFPEQFSRIRDAYEKLDGYMQYREQFAQFQEQNSQAQGDKTGEQAGEAAPDPAQSGERKTGPLPEILPEDIAKPRPQTQREEPGTRAWQKAIGGDWPAAYAELKEQEHAKPGDRELCAKLYWLLALSPKLDENCHRRDWLASSLKKNGLYGPLMELYAREIRGDPMEAFHSRCEELFFGNYPPLQIANFSPLRWEAAASQGEWKIIEQDLERLRGRIADIDRAAWSRLLLCAVESLLWQTENRAAELARVYRKEVETYSDEHRELENEFYRCDSLMELVAGWKKLGFANGVRKQMPKTIRELLRDGWLRPFGTVRPKIMQFWDELTANPRESLGDIDRIYQISPTVVQHLLFQADAIYQQQHDFSIPRDGEEITAALRDFLRFNCRKEYGELRVSTMFFCIRHELSLKDFLELGWPIIQEMHLESTNIAPSLHNDGPLHYMILACLAFWS